MTNGKLLVAAMEIGSLRLSFCGLVRQRLDPTNGHSRLG